MFQIIVSKRFKYINLFNVLITKYFCSLCFAKWIVIVFLAIFYFVNFSGKLPQIFLMSPNNINNRYVDFNTFTLKFILTFKVLIAIRGRIAESKKLFF